MGGNMYILLIREEEGKLKTKTFTWEFFPKWLSSRGGKEREE